MNLLSINNKIIKFALYTIIFDACDFSLDKLFHINYWLSYLLSFIITIIFTVSVFKFNLKTIIKDIYKNSYSVIKKHLIFGLWFFPLLVLLTFFIDRTYKIYRFDGYHISNINLSQEELFYLLVILIPSGFYEELFYRRGIFQQLSINYSLKFSLFYSSLLFTISHYNVYNIAGSLFVVFLLGLLLGYIYYKKGFTAALLSHIYINLLNIILYPIIPKILYNYNYFDKLLFPIITIYLLLIIIFVYFKKYSK